MIYVWGHAAPVVRHSTLKKAVDEAERLRGVTDHSIYVLKAAHCIEGLEPPKSEKKRLKDKKWFQREALRGLAQKAKQE